MVVLGLIVVFPESLELKDFIIEDIKDKVEGYQYSVKKSVNSLKNSLPSFNNISPKKAEVKNYILGLENVKRVYCIGEIPKVIYTIKDKQKGRSINPIWINYQAVIQSGPKKKLKKGYLKVEPKYHQVREGHWFRLSDILWPSYSYKHVFKKWQYQEVFSRFTKTIEFNDTPASKLLDMVRIKNCE
jgi:hypothetical protein